MTGQFLHVSKRRKLIGSRTVFEITKTYNDLQAAIIGAIQAWTCRQTRISVVYTEQKREGEYLPEYFSDGDQVLFYITAKHKYGGPVTSQKWRKKHGYQGIF
jgi:hypothetical protein